MTERDLIACLASACPRSSRQRNALFDSDAEIVDLAGSRMAITVDEFSAEDRFPSDDWKLLGWNLVAATMSDLFAVGAKPAFFLDAFVAPPAMDENDLRALGKGLAEALEACGASLAGGDVGTGAEWRFTGIAIGEFGDVARPMTRRLEMPSSRDRIAGPVRLSASSTHAGPSHELETPPGSVEIAVAGDVIVSGSLGDVNLAAATKGSAVRLELRIAESTALMRLNAAPEGEDDRPSIACMDTSDGFVSALETFCLLDPRLHIEIDLPSLPYASGVIEAARAMALPSEVFLLGYAGEYELVALVPDVLGWRKAIAGDGLAGGGFRAVGRFSTGGPFEAMQPGLHFRRGNWRRPHPGLPDPRNAVSFEAYRDELIALALRLFGTAGGR